MRIVFHGENAASFQPGFADLLGRDAEIAVLPDTLAEEADRRTYASADIVVGVRFDATLPRPEGLGLFHVPGAGYDAVDLAALPPSATVCNCFGHEQAIAEYVMAALLARHVPLTDADRRLRTGDWAYTSGSRARMHGEIAGKTIGLLGFGHIGKAIARRAKAFEMTVHVANRSPVTTSPLVDRGFTLDELPAFWGSVDILVVSVPLTEETRGIVGESAFATMRPDAVIFNVGRGPTIDEHALYEALRTHRIAGAVIDTWYRYPSADRGTVLPSALPFHELPNIVMTPHMSGWTSGTIHRRQLAMIDNVLRWMEKRPCLNVIRPARDGGTG